MSNTSYIDPVLEGIAHNIENGLPLSSFQSSFVVNGELGLLIEMSGSQNAADLSEISKIGFSQKLLNPPFCGLGIAPSNTPQAVKYLKTAGWVSRVEVKSPMSTCTF